MIVCVKCLVIFTKSVEGMHLSNCQGYDCCSAGVIFKAGKNTLTTLLYMV